MDPARDPFRQYFSRTTGPARRVISWGSGRSNPIERFFATVLVVAVGLLVLALLIPLLLVIAVVLLAFTVYLRLRFWWAGRKRATEADAGRENVRVIRRD